MKRDTKPQKTSEKKQQYKKPVLLPLGDIRDVTMGGSPGTGDSGGSFIEDPF